MATSLLTLDDAACLDPLVSGAKAARLARARRAGLPVLPGLVVPADESDEAFSLASDALYEGGSGKARLAAMRAPVRGSLVSELADRLPALGVPVVVRSSSAFEASGTWAGAFSSFFGIEVGDLETAIRGCWASAFSVHALELLDEAGKDTADVRLALLVQPELELESGGVARVVGDGRVEITGVLQSPRDLMSGWATGVQATVTTDGVLLGDDACDTLGEHTVRDVAALAREVTAHMEDDVIEWGRVGGQLFLLQSHRSTPRPAAIRRSVHPSFADALALRVARLAVRFPGPLGEHFVLPWAVGLEAQPAAAPAAAGRADPADSLRRARELATELTKAAWQERGSRSAAEAQAAFAELRGADPDGAIARLRQLRPVDPERAGQLLGLLEGAARALEERGLLPRAQHLWRYAPEALIRLATDSEAPAVTQVRFGPDQWEPFVHGVVMAQGTQESGLGASGGVAAGPMCIVREPHCPPEHPERSVVVAVRPVPALAPLLYRAAGLVTSAGSAGAHLLEVANSLGVPAVVQADVHALLGSSLDEAVEQASAFLVAVDGDAGTVAALQARSD